MYIQTNGTCVNSFPIEDLIPLSYTVRKSIRSYICGNPLLIETIKTTIGEKISCFQIDFDPVEMCFIAKIRKTQAKKMPKFEHSSYFYTELMSNIFRSVFDIDKNNIAYKLAFDNGYNLQYSYEVFRKICMNNTTLLFSISCSGNGVIKINL